MIQFTITEEHLKLIRRLQFDNRSDCAAPSIDIKRPYGNSDVYRDIADIVGIPQPNRDRDEDFSPEQYRQMDKLNRGVTLALTIGVLTGGFAAGRYIATDQYSGDWKLAAG